MPTNNRDSLLESLAVLTGDRVLTGFADHRLDQREQQMKEKWLDRKSFQNLGGGFVMDSDGTVTPVSGFQEARQAEADREREWERTKLGIQHAQRLSEIAAQRKDAASSLSNEPDEMGRLKTESERKAATALGAVPTAAGQVPGNELPTEGVPGLVERGAWWLNEKGLSGLVPESVEKRQSALLGLSMPLVRFKGGQNLTEQEMQREALNLIPQPGEGRGTQLAKLQRLRAEYASLAATVPDARAAGQQAVTALDQMIAEIEGETSNATDEWTVVR